MKSVCLTGTDFWHPIVYRGFLFVCKFSTDEAGRRLAELWRAYDGEGTRQDMQVRSTAP